MSNLSFVGEAPDGEVEDYSVVFNAAVDLGGSDHDVREWAAHAVLIARNIERIGDNTVDIGEQIAFVISGLFREFTDASSSWTS